MASQPSSESHVDWSDSSQHCRLYLQQTTASTLELAISAFISKQTNNYSATSCDQILRFISYVITYVPSNYCSIVRDQQLLRAQLSCEVSSIYTRNFLLRLYEFHIYEITDWFQHSLTSPLNMIRTAHMLSDCLIHLLDSTAKTLVSHTNQLTIPFNPFPAETYSQNLIYKTHVVGMFLLSNKRIPPEIFSSHLGVVMMTNGATTQMILYLLVQSCSSHNDVRHNGILQVSIIDIHISNHECKSNAPDFLNIR